MNHGAVRARFMSGCTSCLAFVLALLWASSAFAQSFSVRGIVHDQTGGVLPGVTVEARPLDKAAAPASALSDSTGQYQMTLTAGTYEFTFSLVNFATVRRVETISASATRVGDAELRYVLSADVLVSGKSTFTNLADAENPAENLVGIAQSASQGAITARQLDARPIMRSGEVLETVPGVVISQHSGEGKGNQYYLRGFNLDHGTDFATTVAGMPVNLPTHGHGQGYSDLNFLIPELVASVQFAKGPYFAEQGDFATAGSANVNYISLLPAPIARVTGGGQGFGRILAAASPGVAGGHLLSALEVEHNDGPWDRPDAFRRINGLVRFTKGDAVSGFALTAMAYRAKWNSTDQVPQRAIDDGVIGRFGNLDDSDGGDTYRYSGSLEWQRSSANATTKVAAFGIGYDLNLFSNFTFFLDDPLHGDQFQQADHRFITGGRLAHTRMGHLAGRDSRQTFGVQLRNDVIPRVGLYHTAARQLLGVVREDRVVESSLGGFAQNETSWTPWLRSLAGLRVDGYHFNVDSNLAANSGSRNAGLVSPKGGLVIGPFGGTEFYVNAGLGFHSNDARGTTITTDPKTGETVEPVTPLVRARGSEVGVRTVAVPHLQSSLSLWSLSLDSELIFVGDAGTTEAGRPSHRYGVEFANYYAPRRWLILDGDVTWSSARFTDTDPAGDFIPGAVRTVVSAGVTVDSVRRLFGSVRLRYFGPRPLVEDGSEQSKATTLTNIQLGYQFTHSARLAVDIFNAFDANDSDIDYFYASRLPGEPAGGVADIHLHPALPRTARISVTVAF